MIGGKVVTSAEQSTHLITNNFAATAKSLTAIVSGIKIVTLSWLDFFEIDSPIVSIPPEEDFFPRDDAIMIHDLSVSRSQLMSDLLILLTDSTNVSVALYLMFDLTFTSHTI
jgi:hypothetical protein